MAVGETKLLGIFYGYPASVIARWCAVSSSTAAAWKAGRRKPSRQALRLFTLHRDERVLDEAWRGWRIRAATLVDPDGNATSHNQLRAYCLVIQYAAELAKRQPDDQEHFYALLRRA